MDASPPSSAPVATPSTSTEAEQSPAGKFNWLENWYPVAWAEDVPDLKPIAVTIWERNYVLFRDRPTGLYVVMDDVCPHRSAPLSEGRLYERETDGKSETILECGYHGWRFACDGKCVDIPVVPLEKRIPAAADVGGMYATHVSVGGLIFVWLGERAKADESKIPIPKELVDADPSSYTLFRNTFRRFPMSFSTLQENAADPAHVSWAHHGSGQGDRNKVPRNGGMKIAEERLHEGFARAISQFETLVSLNVSFQAPTAVYYRLKPSKGQSIIYLMTWTVPISHGKSKMFSNHAITNPPKVVSIMKRFIPRWFEHTITNLILDGDSPLLQRQEHHLQSRERDGYGSAWKNEYTLASGTWDVLVVKLRQFYDKYGPSMPFQTALSADMPPMTSPRQEINDRYEHHTKDCACCAPALRNFKRGTIAALVGAGMSAATALFSGIVYAALAGGGVRFAAVPLKLAGGGGVLTCVALLLLARLLHHFKKLMTYTEIAYELSHAD